MIRQKIWKYLIKKYHKNIGKLLPQWLIIIRAILFPISFFYMDIMYVLIFGISTG